MLDLTRTGMEAFWKAKHPSLNYILESMEAVENWPIDRFESVEKEVIELGKLMPDVLSRHLQYDVRDAFINDLLILAANLFAPRGARILVWAESAFTEVNFLETINKLFEEFGPEKIDRVSFRVGMDRLRFLSKTRLLGDVYGPERMHRVSAAIKKMIELEAT